MFAIAASFCQNPSNPHPIPPIPSAWFVRAEMGHSLEFSNGELILVGCNVGLLNLLGLIDLFQTGLTCGVL